MMTMKMMMITIATDVDSELGAISFHALSHLILTTILWNISTF